MRNAKAVEELKKYAPVATSSFWFQNSTGHFVYAERLKVQLFCPFQFDKFPFDKHACNLTLISEHDNFAVKLTDAIVHYNGQQETRYGMDAIKMKSEILPFEIKLSGLEAFTIEIDGFKYVSSGLTIHLHRKTLGALAGSFYGPTAIFAILSMISFQIDPDVVSCFKKSPAALQPFST